MCKPETDQGFTKHPVIFVLSLSFAQKKKQKTKKQNKKKSVNISPMPNGIVYVIIVVITLYYGIGTFQQSAISDFLTSELTRLNSPLGPFFRSIEIVTESRFFSKGDQKKFFLSSY